MSKEVADNVMLTCQKELLTMSYMSKRVAQNVLNDNRSCLQ